MKITEKILKHVQDLPESLKEEVLDFVEYLELKKKKPTMEKEEKDWSDFSLSNAMRGIENEDTPYSVNDLKEKF